jgi:hypothetical protein
MTEAILVTLFCGLPGLLLLPFGIVAIVKASEASSASSLGDHRRAIVASESAKTWCGLTFGLGIAGWVIIILLSAAK